jgi:hypothetical protein
MDGSDHGTVLKRQSSGDERLGQRGREGNLFEPELEVTAKEHRASRDVTAGWVGKALKTRNPLGGSGVKQSRKARAG